jgi:hypothetical protein
MQVLFSLSAIVAVALASTGIKENDNSIEINVDDDAIFKVGDSEMGAKEMDCVVTQSKNLLFGSGAIPTGGEDLFTLITQAATEDEALAVATTAKIKGLIQHTDDNAATIMKKLDNSKKAFSLASLEINKIFDKEVLPEVDYAERPPTPGPTPAPTPFPTTADPTSAPSTGSPTHFPTALPTGAPTIEPQSCKQWKDQMGAKESGKYMIKPCGTGEKFEVWCDMVTDGGGWTILHSIKAGDSGTANRVHQQNQENMNGNPINHENWWLKKDKKVRVSDCTGGNTETLYHRNENAWFKANKPLFKKGGWTEGQYRREDVALTNRENQKKNGQHGISSTGNSYGGDFGVTVDRTFDLHNRNSYMLLNGGCNRQLLYAYGNCGGYKVNYQWSSSWSRTNWCTNCCGCSTVGFYIAQR